MSFQFTILEVVIKLRGESVSKDIESKCLNKKQKQEQTDSSQESSCFYESVVEKLEKAGIKVFKQNMRFVIAMTIVLGTCSMSFAFDFKALDKKFKSIEKTQQEIKKMIDKAIKNGELTHEELHEHMGKMRKENPNMFPPPPPPHHPPMHDVFIQKLEKAGITKDKMDAARKKGPEAVKELLESHGIICPKR